MRFTSFMGWDAAPFFIAKYKLSRGCFAGLYLETLKVWIAVKVLRLSGAI